MRVQLEGTPYASVEVPADTAYLQRVYIVTPKGAAASDAESTPVRIWVEDLTNGERAYKDTTFNGKGN